MATTANTFQAHSQGADGAVGRPPELKGHVSADRSSTNTLISSMN